MAKPRAVGDYVTASRAHATVQDFHDARVARGRNWPFIHIGSGDGREVGGNMWWRLVGNDRVYDPSAVTKDDCNGTGIINELAAFDVALEQEDIDELMGGMKQLLAVSASGRAAAAWGSLKAGCR